MRCNSNKGRAKDSRRIRGCCVGVESLIHEETGCKVVRFLFIEFPIVLTTKNFDGGILIVLRIFGFWRVEFHFLF